MALRRTGVQQSQAALTEPSLLFPRLRSWPLPISPRVKCNVALFVYRCAATGLNVQGWIADRPTERRDEVYEAIACTACTRVHLVNPQNGKVLGSDHDLRRAGSLCRFSCPETTPPPASKKGE